MNFMSSIFIVSYNVIIKKSANFLLYSRKVPSNMFTYVCDKWSNRVCYPLKANYPSPYCKLKKNRNLKNSFFNALGMTVKNIF